MSTSSRRSSSSLSLLESMNPMALLGDSKELTPHEFLRDFYTQRGQLEKLSDVDALVAAYGHQMQMLYTELDKKYGTTFAVQPPPITSEVRGSEPVATLPRAVPATPRSPRKTPVNKIVLLGNSGVGKTNLITRLHKGEFSDDFTSTIGVEFLTHAMKVDDVDVRAQIWDTAGQERFHAMMATYYRKAAGALLIFDMSNRASLIAVEKWLDQLLDVAEPGLHATLVGNKCDLPEAARVVTTAEAQEFAALHHLSYFETSAKTGHNVERCFHSLIEAIHRARMADFPAESRPTIELEPQRTATRSFFDCTFI